MLATRIQYDHSAARQSIDVMRAAALVHTIRGVLGNLQGYRALHADGRLFRGTLRANEAARPGLSRDGESAGRKAKGLLA
jgi:hypothetical protein